MCPCENGAAQPAGNTEMVEVPLNGSTSAHSVAANGANGHASNGVNGSASNGAGTQRPFNPYAPRASDFLSNVSNFKIIESTLRGEFMFMQVFILAADAWKLIRGRYGVRLLGTI